MARSTPATETTDATAAKVAVVTAAAAKGYIEARLALVTTENKVGVATAVIAGKGIVVEAAARAKRRGQRAEKIEWVGWRWLQTQQLRRWRRLGEA